MSTAPTQQAPRPDLAQSLAEHRVLAEQPGPPDDRAGPTVDDTAHRLHRRRHALGLDLGQIVVLEVGLLLLVGGAALGRLGWYVGVVLAVLAVVVAGYRLHGLWLVDAVRMRAGLRSRRSRSVRPPAPRADGGPVLSGLVARLAPDAGVMPLSGRTGTRYVVLHRAQQWAVLGELRADGGALLQMPGDEQSVPIRRLLRGLGGDPAIATTLQITQTIVPAPAPRGGQDLIAVDSYRQLARQAVPARRRTWLAVGVDALASGEAITVRGGGATGLGGVLLRGLDHVVATVSASGLTFTPIGVEQVDRELDSLLAGPQGTPPDAPFDEQPGSLLVGGSWLQTLAVSGWPRLSALSMDRLLRSPPAVSDATITVSVTFQLPAPVTLTCLVRVTAGSQPALGQAVTAVRAALDQGGVTLQPAWSQQLPAALATLPTAGVIR